MNIYLFCLTSNFNIVLIEAATGLYIEQIHFSHAFLEVIQPKFCNDLFFYTSHPSQPSFIHPSETILFSYIGIHTEWNCWMRGGGEREGKFLR
jgi:hypothetical protein